MKSSSSSLIEESKAWHAIQRIQLLKFRACQNFSWLTNRRVPMAGDWCGLAGFLVSVGINVNLLDQPGELFLTREWAWRLDPQWYWRKRHWLSKEKERHGEAQHSPCIWGRNLAHWAELDPINRFGPLMSTRALLIRTLPSPRSSLSSLRSSLTLLSPYLSLWGLSSQEEAPLEIIEVALSVSFLCCSIFAPLPRISSAVSFKSRVFFFWWFELVLLVHSFAFSWFFVSLIKWCGREFELLREARRRETVYRRKWNAFGVKRKIHSLYLFKV